MQQNVGLQRACIWTGFRGGGCRGPADRQVSGTSERKLSPPPRLLFGRGGVREGSCVRSRGLPARASEAPSLGKPRRFVWWAGEPLGFP